MLSWEPPMNGTARVFDIGEIRKVAKGFQNECPFDGFSLIGEGVAVNGTTMYRVYDKGVCQTFDISDIENPKPIATFELGSYVPSNHANCSQFFQDEDGTVYLYVSGLRGKCFVERITETSSSLVQTISLNEMDLFQGSKRLNMICGDDGFLWLFGSDNKGECLLFAKARRPETGEGDVTLKMGDILDYWSDSEYVYNESVWQGGKMYEGNLFFVFGTAVSRRHIAVYNIYTHELSMDIDLNEYVHEEPEDCELLDGKILLAIYGGTGYYVIDLI